MRYFTFSQIQMVAVSTSGKPRHPVFREYFEQKVKEGKNKPQALVCVARRLVRIIYGMMKPGQNTGHLRRLTTRTDFIFWKQSNGR